MYRILIVANETLEGAHLLEEVKRKAEAVDGEVSVHLVVPASHGHGTWTEGSAKAAAQHRLDDAVVLFKELHVEVTGEVGDPSPVLAISDAFLVRPYDEIVLSTLPPSISRWLKQDAVSRIQRGHPTIPLTHVTAAG